MSLQKTIEVVARLAEMGAIQRYAIAGAVAALDFAALREVLERHKLMDDWLSFCAKAGIENPLQAT
jgi:hypothetical protein